jgi:predicted AlkP superfamily phosphohydrolase/phosphomutase
MKKTILILLLPTLLFAQPVEKVMCIGFDGMDPILLQQYLDDGVMPNFQKLIADGDFKTLETAIPPQSPVAWSNFITGMDPGGHGIFDFIHRDPKTLAPYLSAAEAMAPQRWWHVGNWKIPRGSGSVELLRHGTAFWEPLADAGIDVTIFKVPSNFPPVECECKSLSGMGTPDILGTYGIFSFYTDDPPEDTDISGGRLIPISLRNGRTETSLGGPINSYRKEDPESETELIITVDKKNKTALLEISDNTILLSDDQWSDWITIDFEMVPLLKSVSGICRFYLMGTDPFRLYVTPVNIDPVKPEMPISTPESYSCELADDIGLYYTQGLPDDTKALEEGIFDDHNYVSQSGLVLTERISQFQNELDRFAELDKGYLFFYFNSPDQTCHTFWRNMDPNHPMHENANGLYKDHIRNIYIECDKALGMAMEVTDDKTLLIAMSDHGFAPYNRSFHLNSWLYENGYLFLKKGKQPGDIEYLMGIDWRKTRAYAIGINGLYLNLRGRERRGIVNQGSEQEELLKEICSALEQVKDFDDTPAIKYAYRTDEIYHGPYQKDAPDIIVGYYRGFRGSNESALGEVPAEIFVDNMMKWSGDHCMAADEVPGIIITNRPIRALNPALLDLAPTFMELFNLEPLPEMVGKNIFKGE